MDKQEITTEIRRIADLLKTKHLSKTQFKQNSRISITTIDNKFGSWNQAVAEAGLSPIAQGPSDDLKRQKYSDDDLLQETIRLTGELGKEPTAAEMNARGKFSDEPYKQRWGTFANARKVAYAKYGFPNKNEQQDSVLDKSQEFPSIPEQIIVPQTYKPSETKSRKKVQFGEPIDFRGLRFAPINEQGVVFIFGMVSRELGFLIESVRTDYPDCEGKRCIDTKKQLWEHVQIEFEYRSSNFREHGHREEDCDVIVCWIHDWQECPVEVLELKSQIKYLPNR